MKTQTIEELAYFLKEAKTENNPAPIFFLGAGASKTGGIPLAGEIINDILENHCDNPSIKSLKEEEKTYAKLMECLTPNSRNKLLKGYIDQARINVTHIYLAQLMINEYVDYVLTVNFDNLMLRALALFNEFPSTYDMAILKDMTTTSFKKRSVVYLHGQHHGLWLLNTKEEMAKVNEIIPPILNKIANERPWVFIGYSGDDPIFEHIKNLGRFDNGLYWVSYKDHEPTGKIKDFLEKPNTNSFLIKGYDADSFMLKLNSELGLPQPEIIDKPFTSLKKSLDEIVDIDDEEHFKGVKDRLEISKEQVESAIQKYETEETEKDTLQKEIIALLINDKYPEGKIKAIERKAAKIKDSEINNKLASLFNNWGAELGELAKIKSGNESEHLFQQSFEKLAKAIEFRTDKYPPYYNWGTYLGEFASRKSGDETESLFKLAFEKFSKAIELKADAYKAYSNWGSYLGRLAKIKSGDESELLFKQSFEKLAKATLLRPDEYLSYYNWGSNLQLLAKAKSGDEAESLVQEAFEKLEKSAELGGEVYNLACIYALKRDEDKAFQYLEQSLSNKEITTEFVREDDDWSDYLDNDVFNKLLARST